MQFSSNIRGAPIWVFIDILIIDISAIKITDSDTDIIILYTKPSHIDNIWIRYRYYRYGHIGPKSDIYIDIGASLVFSTK